MKKTCLKVKIGKATESNLRSLKAYLTAILPLWQEAKEKDKPDIVIGDTTEELEPLYFIDPTSIDETMANNEKTVNLSNSLKLIAAELWTKED